MFGFSISATILDPVTLSQAMQNESAGAFVSFEGRVRDHNEGKIVVALDYEVFAPLAIAEGQKILAEAKEKFGVIDVIARHREGSLALGDCAVWVGVLSAHRGEAFAACRYVIDEIKHRLPIWKKEHYADGNSEWVNCQHHNHHASACAEKDLYARQIILPEIGAQGQARLKAAKILVVGAGGLGSAALAALAAAGIGTLGIAEHDRLEASNLHRQMIYRAEDIGKPKAELAAQHLKALNPFVVTKTHMDKVTAAHVEDLFAHYDLVLDCTDNFATKYLLNDAAILFGTTLIQASLYRFEGQMLTIKPSGAGGCLRCLWPQPPAAGLIGACAEVGVLGTLPALFGTLQAHEAIRAILGLATDTGDHLFTFNLADYSSRKLKRQKNADCPICTQPAAIPFLPKNTTPELTITAGMKREALLQTYRWIDLREPFERAAQPLPEAEAMPFSRFNLALFPYPKQEAVLLICAHGIRSLVAAEQLREAGWTRAVSLAGGLHALPPVEKVQSA